MGLPSKHSPSGGVAFGSGGGVPRVTPGIGVGADSSAGSRVRRAAQQGPLTDRAMASASATGRQTPSTDAPARPPEPLARVLARNLVVARHLVGMTQHELAARSGVSRATVAQVESGAGDPRLSTLRDLAGAMGVSPIVLLAGTREVQALAALPCEVADRPVAVADQDLARMREFSASLLHRDWSKGARIGAGIARLAGCRTPGGAATAGLFSVASPGWGTVVGTSLGRLLE